MSKISVVKRVGIWAISQSSGGGKNWSTGFTATFTATTKVNGKVATFALKGFREVTEATKWLQALDSKLMTQLATEWAQSAVRQFTPVSKWEKQEDGTNKKVTDFESPKQAQREWVIAVLKADKAGFQKPVLKK
jgi:hypothetical protein